MHFILMPILWLFFIGAFSGGYTGSCEYVKEEMKRSQEWRHYEMDSEITQEVIDKCLVEDGEKK